MRRFRSVLAGVLPYGAIEFGRRVGHFGSSRCPVCAARIRRFADEGYGYPVLEELQVVGGLFRAADRCPVCHSAARHRLVKFYLDRHVLGPDRRQPVRVLHLAPEKGLTRVLTSDARVRYRSGDLSPERYRHVGNVERLDLLDLAVENGAIDLLLCNHVLEHIPDDLSAMRQIRRVLAPGGRAILQVPLSRRLEHTREGDGSEDPGERIRLYGQSDHVRIYAAADYPARLTEAGFDVEIYNPFDVDAKAATALRLDPFEDLHVCRPR